MINYYSEKVSYYLIQQIMKEIKDKEIMKAMALNIQNEYRECFFKYSPNDKNKSFFFRIEDL